MWTYAYLVIGALWHVTSLKGVISTECNTALGMESGVIKDAQITASHWLYKDQPSRHYDPTNARLNSKTPAGAWCSDGIEENLDQYIQIDLLKDTKVTGIATQGRTKYKEYIEKFQLLYQRDGDSQFRMYNESGTWKEFPANKDNDNTAHNYFIRPVIARRLRIYPRGEEFAIYCTRLEIYGCKWSHQLSALESYSGPFGSQKNGVVMEDSTYDGLKTNKFVSDGLGKLTDAVYGEKNSLLGSSGSPWVAYNTQNPEITFHFSEKKVIKQVMIHVNNNGNDIKVFQHLDVAISSDGKSFSNVKRYSTDDAQRQKIDAYPVVCNLGEVVAKHLRLRFTKDGDWLLISEVVFMTDTYPPKPVIPDRTTDNTDRGDKNTDDKDGGNQPFFTFAPEIVTPRGEPEKSTKDKDSKGLSFPIILTIALVTIVLAIIVGVIIFKSYNKKKNKKHERCNTSQPAHIQNNHKQDNLSLLAGGDERYMPAYHPQPMKTPQNTALIPQNGMYFQPPAMHQGGYNTKIMMS
ncbi:discoidin domain-containing receptor tyrosine kinase B-like [Clytia hemisphaerica]|uniref:F5/8 type C domain-containing protein n=1 Tax=Clytia hemisphaerica TaxID=252671 RepID=A0A7M5U8J7_9CNID